MCVLLGCDFVGRFDIPKFYQEVERVLVPEGGVLAIYGYHLTGPGITFVLLGFVL